MKSVPPSGKATVDALADQWAKLFAIYLYREGIGEVVIAMGDIERLAADTGEPTIVVQELGDGIHVKILPLLDAVALAKANKSGFGKS